MIWETDENPTFSNITKELQLLWQDILDTTRQSENIAVNALLSKPIYDDEQTQRIQQNARRLIERLRDTQLNPLSIEGFLKTHNLNSQEGLALMCLAEALLRIPDTRTKTQLIRDKVSSSEWQSNDDDVFLKKFANLSLFTTGRFLSIGHQKGPLGLITSLVRRFGEPLIRQIMLQAVKIIAHQFVIGETIKKALDCAAHAEKKHQRRHSYDMLGEAAKTQADADRYFEEYKNACIEIGSKCAIQPKKAILKKLKTENGTDDKTDAVSIDIDGIFIRPGLSVKLSALHPRYEVAKRGRILTELVPRVLELAKIAKQQNIALTIDAEESYRLTLSLEVFNNVYKDSALDGWEGLGLAVQAYQKRALFTIRWIIGLARAHKRRIPLRLVKGAYWDSEIKYAQIQGLTDYPVFTQKHHTDVSYLVSASEMLHATDAIYPQFATHNAFTVSAIAEMAVSSGVTDFEFQRLHGMGEDLFDVVSESDEDALHYGRRYPCRVYAPVGNYRDLLAYLVRRLLENGANASFVKQIHDSRISIDRMVADPIQIARAEGGTPHPKIPLPAHLFKDRPNSAGIDLCSETELARLNNVIAGDVPLSKALPTSNEANAEQDNILYRLIDSCHLSTEGWARKPVEDRARMIQNLANVMHENQTVLINMLVHEAKKTLGDAVSEVREAIDFCRYYALNAVKLQQSQQPLPGPTGEVNFLSYHPRGIFVCISPWNFPLAIFIGQIVAALVTGNCVIAKPSSQTPRIAQIAVDMAYGAGVPREVLAILNMTGERLSNSVLMHPKVAGVVFTGSTETARRINQQLAQRPGALIPLIAETGGINAMIVDSSALPEQVVTDVISSAFQSAGQRCSALRLLIVQNDIADLVLDMLIGAMAELKVGPAYLLSTDVGPVIDGAAKQRLDAYCTALKNSSHAQCVYECPLPDDLLNNSNNNFVAPIVFQMGNVSDVKSEVFGPVLHVVRYRGEYLDQIINDINALGYGLTLGLHTRLESTMEMVAARAHVGNIYVNRNMIGAVVGVQPFGGEGMSGTGFKSGGPNYLLKFVTERVYTQNTTAASGNAALVSTI